MFSGSLASISMHISQYAYIQYINIQRTWCKHRPSLSEPFHSNCTTTESSSNWSVMNHTPKHTIDTLKRQSDKHTHFLKSNAMSYLKLLHASHLIPSMCNASSWAVVEDISTGMEVWTMNNSQDCPEIVCTPHIYVYSSVWTPWHNHYTSHIYDNHVRSEVFWIHVGAVNHLFSSRKLSTLWVMSVHTHTHTHTICQDCSSGCKGNLCTGPIWTYKKPYLEPPIPLRVRHVGTNNHPVATLDRWGQISG